MKMAKPRMRRGPMSRTAAKNANPQTVSTTHPCQTLGTPQPHPYRLAGNQYEFGFFMPSASCACLTIEVCGSLNASRTLATSIIRRPGTTVSTTTLAHQPASAFRPPEGRPSQVPFFPARQFIDLQCHRLPSVVAHFLKEVPQGTRGYRSSLAPEQ